MSWVLAIVLGGAGIAAWWWRLHRRAERQRELMLLCQRAGLEFAPLDLRPDTAWLPFEMFAPGRSRTENVVWDRELGPTVRVFDLWYDDPREDGDAPAADPRRMTCAVVPLSGSCPRLRVIPRTITTDVEDLEAPQEVELELETLTRRFRVVTDDARFAFAFLDQRMMEGVLSVPEGVVADVNEDVLLLWSPSLLPAGDVLLLFDAAVRLSRRVPRVVPSLYRPRPSRGAFEERWLQGRWSAGPTGRDAPAG